MKQGYCKEKEMPEYIIRITSTVEILEKVEERVIKAETLAEARREAAYILGEKYALKPDVVADVKEKEENKPKVTEF
jgi:hypothetical protein